MLQLWKLLFSNAAGVTYNVEGNRSYDLVGGKDYSGTDGFLVGKGDVINSYNILKNPAEYSINFILQSFKWWCYYL